MSQLARLYACGVTVSLSPDGRLQARRPGGLRPEHTDYLRRYRRTLVDLLRTPRRVFLVMDAHFRNLAILLPEPLPLAKAQAQARRRFAFPLNLEPVILKARRPAPAAREVPHRRRPSGSKRPAA